jgi:hypothetical protein
LKFHKSYKIGEIGFSRKKKYELKNRDNVWAPLAYHKQLSLIHIKRYYVPFHRIFLYNFNFLSLLFLSLLTTEYI